MPNQFVSPWKYPVLSSIRRPSFRALSLHNACGVVQRGEILIPAEKFTGPCKALGDDELNRFLRQQYFPRLTEAAWRRQCDVARTFPDALRQQGAMPVMDIIGERGERYVAMGSAPIRRSRGMLGHFGSGVRLNGDSLSP